MKFRELVVFLPCHSIEDFPLYHTGDDADSLLVAWTALWHPALVAAADSAPKWHRVDYPPDELGGMLILVPRSSVSQLPPGFLQRARDAGAVVFTADAPRQEILGRVFSQFDGGEGNIPGDLVADFLALGYAYLQIQILTRQMRYASNLDEARFFQKFREGAKAAAEGQEQTARDALFACFNQLAEERDHYYSVDAYLIDVTLVACETVPSAVVKEISGLSPVNLMIPAEAAESWKSRDPDSFRSLLAAIDSGHVGLIGGERVEQRLPLLPCEQLLAQLREGQAAYEESIGRRIEIFGRRQFGLTPFLPGLLDKLRFRGALHATLDNGQFPSAPQTKTRWQGVDSSVIDAVAKPPLDAGKPETFLSFPQKLGEAMDSDHVATLCLAHWPGHASPWYDDLKRCAMFTPALGKFITLEKYFADTYLPGHNERFSAEEYRSPYLRQDVIRKRPDPLSTVIEQWRSSVTGDTVQTLSALTAMAANRPSAERASAVSGDEAAALFAQVLPRQTKQPGPGCLVLNPTSAARRVGLEVTELPVLPGVQKPVYAVGTDGNRKFAVIDVPAMGYAWLGSGDAGTRNSKAEPPLAEDNREKDGIVWLRNEFMQLSIDPVTGSMQTLKDYKARGNRLSQQLALRIPGQSGQPGDAWRDPDELAVYSVMAADEVRVISSSTALGEILSRGRLLDHEGKVLALFRQVFRLWRGSRVLQLDIELEPQREPASDPWNSYYACRFAWPDESASLFYSQNETRQPTSKPRIDAPLFVDIESGEQRISLLTGGLPYHRRIGGRMLDSLLGVRGETSRSFRMGIGLDLSHTLPEAIGILAPALVVRQTAPPPAPENCWLFHLDARSVVATHWSALVQDESVVGVRVRALESSGHSVRTRLSAFRSFTSARQVNFLGEIISELPLAEGKVVLDLAGNEWIEVEAKWT